VKFLAIRSLEERKKKTSMFIMFLEKEPIGTNKIK
jgi:hypothetical protein